MKKIGFFIAAVMFSQIVFGQINVVSNGNVGIGTNNPQNKLHVNGALLISYGNYNGKLRIAGGSSAPIIGSTTGVINFWSSDPQKYAYNVLNAKAYKKISDSTVKEQIAFFDNGLNVVTQLNTYSYYFKDDSTLDRKREFGLLAQEVESILPELVDTSMGYKLLDYDQFIPFLINSIKEQQVQIEEHQGQIEMLQQLVTYQEMDLNEFRNELMILRADLDLCCEGKSLYRGDTLTNYKDTTASNKPVLNDPVLYQNIPNPFNTDTRIS